MAMKKVLTTQWNTWNQWNKTALLLREKRKKRNNIQSPIKETYNNSNGRALEVSVRPLNSICLTKTKVHCSVGSRHHKPLTGRDVVDIRTSAVSEVYVFILLQTELFFIGIVKAKTVSIPPSPFFPFLVGRTILNAIPAAGARNFLLSTAFILVLGPASLLSNWNWGRWLLGLSRWSMKLIISGRLWVQGGAEIYLQCRICLYDMVLNLARGSL